jgi:hypothetical protein
MYIGTAPGAILADFESHDPGSGKRPLETYVCRVREPPGLLSRIAEKLMVQYCASGCR